MQKVIVYSTPTCHYCHDLKNELVKAGIEYDEVNVAADRDALNLIVEKTGRRAVPVTQIGDEFVVGFEIHRIKSIIASNACLR